MGAFLRRLLRRAARPLYTLVDRVYRRWHRLERVGGILWVGRDRWRGSARRLEDGTEVRRGDLVLSLHLDGQLAAADAAGAGSPAAAGRRFARRCLPAMGILARRLRDDPAWREIVAVHGIAWIAPYVGQRQGWELHRLPDGFRARFIRWHLGNLLAVADPGGGRRQRPWPAESWISSRRLCERFLGPEAPG